MNPESKNFENPDEKRPIPNGAVDIVKIAGATIGRTVFQAGWRWSNDVKPLAKTDLCQAEHFGYCISGALHVKMQDGREFDFKAGDVGVIPAGHDAWVVGNEAYVAIDWAGMSNYARQ